MNDLNHDDKETPPGSEDNASQIRLKQERRDVLHHTGGGRVTGSAIEYPWGQPERIGGDDGTRHYLPRGSEIVGGTLSQLIKDCKDQIAGNDRIINSLRETNDLLEERVSHYEQLLSRIKSEA